MISLDLAADTALVDTARRVTFWTDRPAQHVEDGASAEGLTVLCASEVRLCPLRRGKARVRPLGVPAHQLPEPLEEAFVIGVDGDEAIVKVTPTADIKIWPCAALALYEPIVADDPRYRPQKLL